MVAVLAGMLAGLVTSVVVSGVMARRDRARPSTVAEGEPAASAQPLGPRAAGALPDEKLARLERRLGQLERRTARPDDPPAPPPPSESGKRRYEEQLRHHGEEAADPRWAPETTSLIEGDIRSLAAKGSFRLNRVDCRTQLCTAELEWPSPEKAGEEYLTLVQLPYRANCVRTLVPPDAAEPGQPVRAKLLFECASWRNAGSQPLQLGLAGDQPN